MPTPASNRTTWIIILALAFGLRLAGGYWWQARLGPEQTFFFGDSLSYWRLGESIARGELYAYPTAEFRAFRMPGYPLLLAGLFRMYGGEPPVMAARALSAALGGIAVGLVGWWTTQLFDARAGRAAGWIAALYPGAVSMGVFVLSEAPFCVLMLAQLALWGQAWRAATNRSSLLFALAAGLAAGGATLVRPGWLLFTPFALGVALLVDRRRAKQLWLGAVMCAAIVICLLPWWIRNQRVAGIPWPTTSQFGASLYDGLNPTADGSSNMDFMGEFAQKEHEADTTSSAPFELRLNSRLTNAALDWARANPARVAQLAVIKFVRIWNVWPNEPTLRSWPLRLGVFCTYTPLLCLSLVGVWKFTRAGWPYILAWLPAIYLTLVQLVLVGSIRYREPAMLALIVLAAAALCGSLPNLRKPDTPPAPLPS